MTRTVRLRNEPYHKQLVSVICTVSVRPYRRTRVVRQVLVVTARAARSAGVLNRAPRVRGRPERPVRGGGSSCSTEPAPSGVLRTSGREWIRAATHLEPGRTRLHEQLAADPRAIRA